MESQILYSPKQTRKVRKQWEGKKGKRSTAIFQVESISDNLSKEKRTLTFKYPFKMN